MRLRPVMSTSQQKSVKIGTRPFIIGMPRSWSGCEARSAMSAATTNSDSSSSPSCRLPRTRIVTSSARYIIIVLMIIIAMGNAPDR